MFDGTCSHPTLTYPRAFNVGDARVLELSLILRALMSTFQRERRIRAHSPIFLKATRRTVVW
jgi:hypothetical protein